MTLISYMHDTEEAWCKLLYSHGSRSTMLTLWKHVFRSLYYLEVCFSYYHLFTSPSIFNFCFSVLLNVVLSVCSVGGGGSGHLDDFHKSLTDLVKQTHAHTHTHTRTHTHTLFSSSDTNV